MATKSHKCTDKFMTPGNTMEVVQARRYFFSFPNKSSLLFT